MDETSEGKEQAGLSLAQISHPHQSHQWIQLVCVLGSKTHPLYTLGSTDLLQSHRFNSTCTLVQQNTTLAPAHIRLHGRQLRWESAPRGPLMGHVPSYHTTTYIAAKL